MTNTFETNAQQCDVTTNSFHVEKPCNGSNASIALSSEAPTQFEFGLEDISGFQMLDGGSLMISFVEGDETLVIENYAAMMESGEFQEISLNDGETINLAKLAEGLSPSAELAQVADAGLINDLANIEPAAGDEFVTIITKSNEYELNEGETYQTDFNQADVVDAQVNENGDLVISFVDETQTTITNFKEIESAEDIPTMTLADGSVIPVTDLLTQAAVVPEVVAEPVEVSVAQPTPSKPVQNTVEQEIAQARPEQLDNISPASGDGSDLANIAPQAGDAGPLGNIGAGFGSDVDGSGFGNVGAVGPIGVTSLNFDRPEFEDDDFFFSPAANPPVVIANQAAGYEDNAINFGVFAQSSDAEECIEIIIENIPTGWTPVLTDATTAAGVFDAATGTWTLSLPVGESLTSGPVFMPPLNSDADISPLQVTVNQKDPVTLAISSTSSTTFNVIVDAVADEINLSVNNVVGTEDTPAPLNIATSLTDVDGSEEITQVLICNVPAGFMLNSGTEISPGNFLVDQADLAILELTPPANYSGTVSLEIKVTNEEVNFSDTEFDFTNNVNVTTLPFDVTFAPVADAPTLEVADAQVKEDGNVDLPIKAELTDPSEALTIRVENLDNTWGVAIGTNNGVYNAATGVWEITLPAGQNYDGAINLTPPANSDLDMNDIIVTAISTESNGATAATSETIDVVTDAVADAPTLTGNNVAGTSGSVYQLNLANALTDADGSETLGNVTISGVPTGFTLTAGTEVAPGVWEVPQADVSGVGINTPVGYQGGFDLSVSVTTTETPTDTEYDFTDNQATTTIPLSVNLTLPELNAPTVNIAGKHEVLEDGSVVVPFSAALATNALPTDVLTVTLSGIDSSWTIETGTNNGAYDAVTGTWTITLPAGQDYNGAGLTFTPPADSDLDMSGLVLTATADRPSNNTSTSANAGSEIIVDAVADMPAINAGADKAVNAGDAVAIDLTNALTDTDGSESLGVVTVSGVPTGYSLTAGTEVAPGIWEVAQADLAGLSLNTPSNATGGDVTLTVSVTSTESVSDDDFDLTNNTATNTDTVVISVNPDKQPPEVTFGINGSGAGEVLEDGSVFVPITGSLNGDAAQVLTVEVSGIPSTWTIATGPNNGTYNATTGTWTITLPEGQDYNGGLTFTPPADSDVDLTGLTVTATSTLVSNNSTSSSDINGSVVVDAVADTPNLNAGSDKTVVSGKSVALNISDSLTDTDGSETLGNVTISGVPTGYSLNQGTEVSPGVWELTQAELNGLRLNTPTNGNGMFELSVSVTSTESVTDTDFDLTNNTATATDKVKITVNPDNNPPQVTFGANGSGQGEVLEDNSVFVPITATLNGDAPQVLTVEVSGIPSDWTINNADGSYNATTGTWTITLPEGQDYNGGLTFTPPADSDVDLTGLTVTATSTTTSNNETLSSTTDGKVTVDAVADKPNLNAGADKVVEAGQSVAIDISSSLTDTDGSETLSVITISGVPVGYSLNQGAEVSPGVWEVSQADLAGLQLNTPNNAVDGNVTLNVSVMSTEQVTDGETRLDNNKATNTDTVVIKVNADDDPVLSNPTPLTVDETDLNPTDTDGNTLTGDFGRDNPGTFEVRGANTFSFTGAEGGNLTSNGVPVVVTVVGNTFVGKAGAEEIFTLDLNITTGKYDFVLKGTLDHADETNPDDIIELKFGVSAKDSDGDIDNGVITVNVKDDAPIAGDDCNEFNIVQTGKDYNVVLALDISGSMDGEKLALLKSSVTNLLNDFGSYEGGDIKVHITNFSSTVTGEGTFAVSSSAGLDEALAYIDALAAGGTTNYEAPLQSAISWLEGDSDNDPIANADTYTYFVSDGAPNRYIDASGNVVSGGAATVMGEITGSDGSNEVAILQGLSTEVIGVGIGVDGATLARLGQIDSDGNALNVQNPTDLDAALQGSNPLNGKTSGNVLTGEGNAFGTSDNLSNDVDNVLSEVTFGGQTVAVNATNGAVIDGTYGTLVIQADGSYTYTVTAQNLSGDIRETFGYTVVDADGDTSSADLILKGNFTPIDLPPTVTFGDGSARVLEDGSVVVPITASLTGDASQVLTVEVSGIDPSWTITTGANNGTYNSNTGTWTITLPEGQDYNGGLTFKPAGNSDVDLTGLTVTATSTNTATNAEKSSTTNGSVIVDAVADAPVINAGSDKVVEAGQSVVLNVSNNLRDTDGSETLGNVTVSGIPAGYSLNKGTEVSNGVWEVSQGDLNGLRLNTPVNGTGMVELTMSVTSTESVTDTDYISNNNTATSSDKVKITVNPGRDDKPEISNASETIDETNLVNGIINEVGNVKANFGEDGPGRFEIDGRFTSSGADNGNLTHNGVDVVVTRTGDTYTGKAGNVDVFTLKVNSNGAYEFNLIENLDHNQPNQANEVINLTFGVDAVDADGDRADGTITISVKDDVPSISGKAKPIDEDGFKTNDVISYTHTLSHSYGEDGKGSIDPTGTFVAKFQQNGLNATITSNGVAIVVSETASGYVGKAGNDKIFDLVVNDNGQYTYRQFDGIDHQNAQNPDDVIWLKFQVKITDFDGDVDTAYITVDVHDSAPVAMNDTNDVHEGQMITGNVITNDMVGGDDPATITMVNGKIIELNGLTVVGQYGTLIIQQNGSYKYTANNNNPDGVDSFSYVITDADGDSDLGALNITVTSTNDLPVANDDFVTLWSCDWATLGNVMTGYNQNNNGADKLSADGGNEVISMKFDGKTHEFKSGGGVMSVETEFGYFYMFKDGSYAYISEQDSPKSSQYETFSYTIQDADGDTSTADLKIIVREVTETQNEASDYGAKQGNNTVINGKAAYKTDDTDGAQIFGKFNDTKDDYEDVLSGNSGNDAIYGWKGNDTLYGGAGNDILFGEQDSNTLYGGSGSDMFEMESDKANNNNKFDTIMDFDLQEGDVLSLVDVISGFGSGDDINDFVRIKVEGSTAVVQVNSNGSGSDFYDVAKIKSHADLNANTLDVDDLFNKGHIDVY